MSPKTLKPVKLTRAEHAQELTYKLMGKVSIYDLSPYKNYGFAWCEKDFSLIRKRGEVPILISTLTLEHKHPVGRPLTHRQKLFVHRIARKAKTDILTDGRHLYTTSGYPNCTLVKLTLNEEN